MRKLYFLFFTLLITSLSFGQITELYISMYGEGSSNNKFLEIYNGTGAAVNLDNYAFATVGNAPTVAGEYEFWNTFPTGFTIADGDVFVIVNPSADATILAQGDMTFQFLSNGDDGLALVLNDGTFNDANSDGIVDAGEMTGFTILDWLGDWDGDPGSGWDVAGVASATANHTLTRKTTVCGPNNSWTSSAGTDASNSEWIVTDSNSGWGNLGSYTGCVTTPSLTITAPSEGAILSSAASTSLDVTFSIENFSVATAGNGDGHIHYSVDGGSVIMQFDTNTITLTGLAAGAHTIFMELVDDSHTPIDPAVNQTVNFTIELPCDLNLAGSVAICDATTAGVDTYTATVDFTGGNTGITYTVSSTSGTVSGDDPSTATSGTITVTGINEGTDIVITVVGGTGSSCDLNRNISSPTCRALPFEEPFDYAVGTNLGDAPNWENNNSGDEVLISSGSLSYSGLKTSTGNSVSFDGSGTDPSVGFSIASGTAYASFIFQVTDQTAITDLNDGGYFAILGNFDARLWVRPNPDATSTTFDIGFGNVSSNPPFTASTFNVGDDIFVVMSYETGTGNVNAWINPAGADLEGSAPTATLSGVDGSPSNSINQFLIRQDSGGETPSILIDELRIGTSWADVTPTGGTASVRENDIPGFNMYPNPVTNGRLTINTFSNANKEIQIFDILGKRILSANLKGRELNVSKLNSGIYILKILEEGKTATRKLVIK